MRDLLTTYYAIDTKEDMVIDGKLGFKNKDSIYFTISAFSNKVINMEQTALAYYLFENGFNQTALPIPNIYGDWITDYRNKNYIVVQVSEPQRKSSQTHGKLLAYFHQVNTSYQYEPHNISSYGQWKQLWIDKLTVFENKIIEEAKKHSNSYYRLLMDILPYLIGISENAIQYIQESGHENRYDEADKGTISFQRYKNNLVNTIIWPDDLAYDHLTRDMAEHIRERLLQNGGQGLEEIRLFIKDYQSIRPLSVFSWRMLYARLIFPIHLFDMIENSFSSEDYTLQYQKATHLLEKQAAYEDRLDCFFQEMGVNSETLSIPMVKWLQEHK